MSSNGTDRAPVVKTDHLFDDVQELGEGADGEGVRERLGPFFAFGSAVRR